MSVFWSERARALTPYVPGEQPRHATYIKLNTNENAYPPSPDVALAIAGEIPNLKRYPSVDGFALREVLAERGGVPVEWTFVGNGSDEVLAFAFAAFAGPERAVSMPSVTYSFYPIYADLFDAPVRLIPMASGLRIDVDLFPADGLAVLANPNAPTSIALPLADIRRLAQRLFEQQQALIVDEAYIAFGGESAVALLDEFPNLLVVGTLSKSHALAGLRVGYALGQPHLIEGLTRVKDSFNSYPLDRLAIVGAAAALRDEAYFARSRDAIVATREATAQRLRAAGFEVLPSAANFVFVRFPGRSGEVLCKHLREHGILVRHFDKPEVADWVRITIGTDEEMAAVCAAMEEEF